jgi:hypothetical protein
LKVDGPVPIRVEIGPKTSVRALLAVGVHWSSMVAIDGFLLCLLRIFDDNPVGALLR